MLAFVHWLLTCTGLRLTPKLSIVGIDPTNVVVQRLMTKHGHSLRIDTLGSYACRKEPQ